MDEEYPQDAITPAIFFISIVTSAFSLLGCFVIFATWVVFKDTRSSCRQLLLYLTLADFILALSNLMGSSWAFTVTSRFNDSQVNLTLECENPSTLCVVQSFFGIFAVISSFLWTIVIAWRVRESIIKNSTDWTERYPWILHIIAWGIPLATAVTILRYQRSGFVYSNHRTIGGTAFTAGWCWVKVCQSDFDVGDIGLIVGITLAAGKAWEILVYITVPLIYTMVRWELKSTIRQTESVYVDRATIEAVRDADRVMKAIPVMFIFLRMWGTIRYVANMAHWATVGTHEGPIFHVIINMVLAMMQAFGDSGQGFGNCLIYCVLTDTVRRKICSLLGFRPDADSSSDDDVNDCASIRGSCTTAILYEDLDDVRGDSGDGARSISRSTPLVNTNYASFSYASLEDYHRQISPTN